MAAQCQCQRCGVDFALAVDAARTGRGARVSRAEGESSGKQRHDDAVQKQTSTGMDNRRSLASALQTGSNDDTRLDGALHMAESEHSLLDVASDGASDYGSYYDDSSGHDDNSAQASGANTGHTLSSRDAGHERHVSDGRAARGMLGAAHDGQVRGMDESDFVVLSSNSATGGRAQLSPKRHGNGRSLDSRSSGEDIDDINVTVSQRMNALEKLFDFVETEGEIEAPLCLQCSSVLRKELEDAIVEAETDALEYENAVNALEIERDKRQASMTVSSSDISSKDEDNNNNDADTNVADIEISPSKNPSGEDAEERWRRRFSKLTDQMKALDKETASLDITEHELSALEDRYWQDYNDYMFQLQQHRHTRDAILARIEATTSALEALRQTNVFNDVFHIWHDGPFGTISGFRLGRIGINNGSGAHTSSTVVEWDEINAAWGQCVLLLSTMASACKFTFTSYRLLPMGSYSKVIDDRKNTLELFGPISSLNPFKRTNFDRAMVGFLRCLQELAEFASTTDKAATHEDMTQMSPQDQRAPEEDNGSSKSVKPFSLPYSIDGDKISGKTIKLTFNREDKWTAALKLMLADLKCLLVWVARHINAAEKIR